MSYINDRWAVFQGDKVVPESYRKTGFCVIAQCYLAGGSNMDDPRPEVEHAKRIVECHNAMLGIPDPAQHLAQLQSWHAQFKSVFGHLGSTPDEVGNVWTDKTDEMALRIKELEEALTSCAASLRDLANDWPQRELHEPVQMSLDRVERLIPGWDA